MIELIKREGSKKNNILFMVFFLMLLSYNSCFAQAATENNIDPNAAIEKSNIVNSNIEINTMKQQSPTIDSNMSFILWFMGSKQSPNSSVLPIGTATKKHFMTSGTEPNRLLINAFLKKAVSFESSMS